MSESNKKTLRTITTVLVCLAIVFAFFISIIRVFGFKVYGVLTGSMEPAYPTGSLIYVRDVDTNSLRIGDVITFSLSPNVIATHRIVDIIPDENNPSMLRFQTKGDANQSVDASLVSPTHVIGKVIFSVPYLGDIANYIQNPPGTYVAILVSGILIVLVFLTDAATGEKLKSLQKKERAPQQQAPAAAGYPMGQQPGAYQQMPVQPGYPPSQSMQQPPVPNAYPQQQEQMQRRFPAQQPVQNGYPQQGSFPQQQMNGYPYQQPVQGQYQQHVQPAYPQRQQPMQGQYRPQQTNGYVQQPAPQPRVNPAPQGYQPQPQQQVPQAGAYPTPARPNFQTGGFVPSAQNEAGAQRRRRSNQSTY